MELTCKVSHYEIADATANTINMEAISTYTIGNENMELTSKVPHHEIAIATANTTKTEATSTSTIGKENMELTFEVPHQEIAIATANTTNTEATCTSSIGYENMELTRKVPHHEIALATESTTEKNCFLSEIDNFIKKLEKEEPMFDKVFSPKKEKAALQNKVESISLFRDLEDKQNVNYLGRWR